jgi:hypothetical protein
VRWRSTLFVMLACSACSLATSWSDLPLGRGPDSGEVDADALKDAELDAHDASDGAKVDAGACTSGRYYCGGDGVVGDPTTLYRCGINGSAAPALVCMKGCAHKEPSKDDACVCVAGGFYCGNDQVLGDPNKLYQCNADNTATLVQTCPKSCVVRTGQDDICN